MQKSTLLELTGPELSEICKLLGEENYVTFMVDLISSLQQKDFVEQEITKKFKVVNYLIQNDASVSETKIVCFENILDLSLQFVYDNVDHDYLGRFSLLLTYFVDYTIKFTSAKMETAVNNFVKYIFKGFDESPKDFNLIVLGTAINFSLAVCDLKLNVLPRLELREIGHSIRLLEPYQNFETLYLADRILNLVFELPSVILKQCLKLFGQIILLEQDSTLLKKLWLKVESKLSRGSEEEILRGLAVICYLGDNYISVQNTVTSYMLYNETSFWKIVQISISKDNRMIRKMALYILKRYIYELETLQECVQTELFWFDGKCRNSVETFHTLFIVIEILEGTQVHIVSQIFQELDKLIFSSFKSNLLHPTWLSCVFIRFFHQDSIVILRNAIKQFASVDPMLWTKDYNYKSLYLNFFKSINNMLLFSVYEDFNLDEILEKWFCKSVTMLSDILLSISLVSWSPIALFHVTKALSKTPSVQAWDVLTLDVLKSFIVQALRTQTVIIRGAIQTHLLNCVMKLTCENVELLQIGEVLNVFKSEECLRRGTKEWTNVEQWMKSFITQKQADFFISGFMEKFLYESASLQSISRVLLMLSEIGLFNPKNPTHNQAVHTIFNALEDCDKRAYSAVEKQNISIKLIFHLLNEGQTDFSPLLKIIHDNLAYVFLFIKYRLQTVTNVRDLNDVSTYVKVLKLIFENPNLLAVYTKEAQVLLNTACSEILAEFIGVIQEHLCLNIINLYFSYVTTSDLKPPDFTRIFRPRILKRTLLKKPPEILLTELKMIHSQIVALNVQLAWDCLSLYIKEYGVEKIYESFCLSALMEEAQEALNTGGKESVVPILSVFNQILIFYKDIQKISNFINLTWQTCFEFRKTELFWKAINLWISMLFNTELIKKSDLQPIIKNFAFNLLSQGNDISGLANVLSRHLHAFDVGETPVIFDDIFVECLLFGSINRRDQKLEFETCNYIHSQGDAYAINKLAPHIIVKSELEVRLQALNILFKNSSPENNIFIFKMVKNLIQEDRTCMKNNKRYFNDSLVHRRKNRTLQVLLIIQRYIANHLFEFDGFNIQFLLYDWAVEALLSESQQPSIRYQLELLFINLCIDYPLFKTKFWNVFDKAGDERIGSLTSFICIAFHLAKTKIDNEFFEELINYVLPCCMSQNFNLRLYGQVAMEKLWPYYPEMAEKYKILYKNQWKIFAQGNMLINVKKLQSDFYFNIFDCKKHFTLQTIFWDLPRLSNISQDEWISISYLKSIVNVENIGIPLGEKSELIECESPSWVLKASEISVREESTSIQKKFVPWKGMLSELELEETRKNRKEGGMILVTSLIDKSANLGGLARTCDIFGVKELVVGNLELTKDKSFTSLSMTAEKHINITEVKARNLTEYLTNLKQDGYTVVGAEQTTTSVFLSEYKFPYKTLLVLGNEREGIPADIILHLDACVEIPQFGVIRSLNVHVSGAIFLWEYAKQHLCSKK
ncbi:uncharacterized protein LOC106665533 [Cimex lectularius]|uniref:tRNA (guanosine(18)-2'-O)-methyltransferase TARBP1 n=1 Tax=Cimex lectularius TaxID=79782 RepID=A0A8I6RL80_CIMLE|nr:uncharacterized protein LOC106665533 [Cimex lectularius]